jgi:hypothetical protein
VRVASRRSGLPADLLAGGLLLLTSCFLINNPLDLAPIICDTIIMLPAVASLRTVGHGNVAPKLDYCLFIGTAFTVESVVGKAAVGKASPIWWLVKFLIAIMAWGDQTVRLPLTLELVSTPIAALTLAWRIDRSSARPRAFTFAGPGNRQWSRRSHQWKSHTIRQTCSATIWGPIA